ncbi:Hsp70 family protein [Microbacterium sp. GXF7504]
MGPLVLAIDVGTSRICAAVARPPSPDPVPFALGRASDTAASAVFVGPHDLLFGDAADRRSATDPARIVRDVVRRVGDQTPYFVESDPHRPEDLYAQIVAWVIAQVGEREGRDPDRVVLTVPAVWGEHRAGLVTEALERQGVMDVRLVGEPEAAAEHYESAAPLRAGQTIAVYDLGAGGFSSAVLRKTEDGALTPVGIPGHLDSVGGRDLDDAVFEHVLRTAGVDVEAAASAPLALQLLRRECIAAKEALSFDTETVVPVVLPGTTDAVRLTRAELEAMAARPVARTVEALSETVADSGVDPAALTAVILIGGGSRMPLVAQALSERFPCRIAVDTDPKAAIALGAARHAALDLFPAMIAPDDGSAVLLPAAVPAQEPVAKRRRFLPRALLGSTAGVLGLVAVGLTGGALGTASTPSTWVTDRPVYLSTALAAGVAGTAQAPAETVAALDPAAGPEILQPQPGPSPRASQRPSSQPGQQRAATPFQTTPSRSTPTSAAGSSSPSSAAPKPASSAATPTPSTATTPDPAPSTTTPDPPAETPTDPGTPAPVDPTPVDPTPADPAPVDPAPVDPPPDPGPAPESSDPPPTTEP